MFQVAQQRRFGHIVALGEAIVHLPLDADYRNRLHIVSRRFLIY